MPFDSIAGPAGSATTIVIDGETLILEPLTLEDIGIAENHLQSKQPDILGQAARAIQYFPPEQQAQRWREALAECRDARISSQQVLDWLQGEIEGVAFAIWICLEKRYKGRFTLSSVLASIQRMAESNPAALEQVSRGHAAASGIGPEGNSHGQNRKKRRRRRKPA